MKVALEAFVITLFFMLLSALFGEELNGMQAIILFYVTQIYLVTVHNERR